MFEEHKYEELKKLGLELHIPIFESFLKLEVFDKDSNLVQEHSQRSHSWVRNAYNMLFSQMAGKNGSDSTFGAGLLSIKDTGATIRYGGRGIALAYNSDLDTGVNQGYRAAAGDATHGIQVGIGTNAESFEDYVLQTLVADGTGAAQLSYVLSSAHSITYTAGTKVLKNDLVRYFNNNSGGSIVIAEVAITLMGAAGGTATYEWVNSRDLLGATVTVADTGQLKATYTIQITYPA